MRKLFIIKLIALTSIYLSSQGFTKKAFNECVKKSKDQHCKMQLAKAVKTKKSKNSLSAINIRSNHFRLNLNTTIITKTSKIPLIYSDNYYKYSSSSDPPELTI